MGDKQDEMKRNPTYWSILPNSSTFGFAIVMADWADVLRLARACWIGIWRGCGSGYEL